MASIIYKLSQKGDIKKEVILKLGMSGTEKYQCKVAGLQVYAAHWSDKKQRMTGKYIPADQLEEVEKVNGLLAGLKSEVAKVAARGGMTRERLKEVVEAFMNPKEEQREEPQQEKTILAVYDEFLKNAPYRLTRTGKPIGERVLIQYRNTRKRLGEFISSMKKEDLQMESLNKAFYDRWVIWLYDGGYKKNTIGKHIKNVKAVINTLPQGEKMNVEFVEVGKCEKLKEEVDNIYLTEEELSRLAAMQIAVPYLDRVRDQFLLLAWTGCRYGDLKKLRKENMYKTPKGVECFRLEQEKTERKVVIPVLPPVRRILEKYNYEPPRSMANCKFNEYLKKVCQMAGINGSVTITHTMKDKAIERKQERFERWQVVSAHTARRSFATNMYKRGFDTNMIMHITGHKNIEVFLNYIKVKEEENAERMVEKFMKQERG